MNLVKDGKIINHPEKKEVQIIMKEFLKLVPTPNPLTVFREEFDDWAILFDPETGNAYGLNPVGAFIWKQVNGEHTILDIIASVCSACKNVPEEVEEHVKSFLEELKEKGFVGYEEKIPGKN